MAGKKYREAAAQVDYNRAYSVDEAVELTMKVAFAKFDETVELGMTLESIRAKRTNWWAPLFFPRSGQIKAGGGDLFGGKVQEARDAGADEVGGDDIVTRIKGGWVDFDA
jgi:large subunit ribosomal protein L1